MLPTSLWTCSASYMDSVGSEQPVNCITNTWTLFIHIQYRKSMELNI